MKHLIAWTLTVGLLVGLPAPAWAAQAEAPSGEEMIADVALARPVGAVVTVIGAAAFLVSLPFTALGGNVDQAAQTLVVEPARETFVRCLGCRNSGRQNNPDK